MSDDILREASQALREVTAEDNQGNRFTRARIMTSLHQRRQRVSTRIALLVPLAAILIGSTAWAGATGKLPEVWVFVADVIGVQVAEEREDLVVERSVAGKAKARLAEAPIPSEPSEQEPAEPEAEPEKPADESAPADATAKARARVPAKAKSGPDTHLLYRAAHRAHFEQGDPAAALRGWDEYLRAAPRGRFSVEARYNRALCLVRLGRKAEARSALAPFARGAYGNYRQREAQELVEALGGAAP